MEQKTPSTDHRAYDQPCMGYIVGQGDTLSVVASRFNVTEESLRLLNHIENAVLQPGRRLLIPLD